MTKYEKYGVLIGAGALAVGALYWLANGGLVSSQAATADPTTTGQGYVLNVPDGFSAPQAVYTAASFAAPNGVTGPVPFNPNVASNGPVAWGSSVMTQTGGQPSMRLVGIDYPAPANSNAPAAPSTYGYGNGDTSSCGCGGGSSCPGNTATVNAYGSPADVAVALANSLPAMVQAALDERNRLATLQGYGAESMTGGALNYNPFVAGGSGPHAII